MEITIIIPKNYVTQIISNIRNTGNSARMQDAAVRNLNVQPDGSINVQTSSRTRYGAALEVFAQNSGIPIDVIRGFDSRITSEGEKGVSPKGMGGKIDIEDIYGPVEREGPLRDRSVSFDEEDDSAKYGVAPGLALGGSGIGGFNGQTSWNNPFSRDNVFDEEDDAAKYGVAPGLLFGGSEVDNGVVDDGVVDDGSTDGAAGLGGDDLGGNEIDNGGVVNDGMPANLPQFWKEQYDVYLGLPENQQQAILDNQLQNFDDLDDWAISTSSFNLEKEPGPMNFEGFPVTGLQDMLNIFYSDPSKFIVEQPVVGTTGYDENGNPIEGIVGSQQSLSPAAQAALQAFSTQRGAESADVASRFGTATPFGVIAGMGGETAAADAVGLAELQARAGVSNPFAALGTGSTIGDIGTILRGGLSAQQQSDLAGLQARGGLGVEDQFALAGMQARGGLTPQQMQALAGLQARGGLTPQQRYAEQRLAMMPSLLQMSPQSLGGFSEVFGGPDALQEYLSPFFTHPDFAAQGAAPAVDWGPQQALPQSMAPATGTPMEPYVDSTEWGTGGVPMSTGGGVPNLSGSPFVRQPINMNIAGSAMPQGQATPVNLFSSGRAQQSTPVNLFSSQMSEQPTPSFRPTLRNYQDAGMFDQGGFQAQAGMAGQELPKFLGEVSPQGTSTSRGGLGATTTGRFTY